MLNRILIWLERLRFENGIHNIILMGIEYDIESSTVNKWLDSCYDNHKERINEIS